MKFLLVHVIYEIRNLKVEGDTLEWPFPLEEFQKSVKSLLHSIAYWFLAASDGVLVVIWSTACTVLWSSSHIALYTILCLFTADCPSNAEETTSMLQKEKNNWIKVPNVAQKKTEKLNVGVVVKTKKKKKAAIPDVRACELCIAPANILFFFEWSPANILMCKACKYIDINQHMLGKVWYKAHIACRSSWKGL